MFSSSQDFIQEKDYIVMLEIVDHCQCLVVSLESIGWSGARVGETIESGYGLFPR